MAANGELPLIDEHNRLIGANVGFVWASLLESLEASRKLPIRRWCARLLGCSEWSGNELPLRQVGATTPGFAVAEAIPLSRLVLIGRHHFSEYALEFEIEVVSATTTRIRARTRASFPDLRGKIYRALVIGSRIHLVAMKSTLRGVKRRAEADATPKPGTLAP